MNMRNSPSGKCCAIVCEILDSNEVDYLDKFTEVTGTWSTGTSGGHGYWETTSSVAAIATTIGAEPGVPWRVLATFVLTPSGTSVWRVAGGGSDVNNYLYAELRITSSGGSYYAQIAIGQVTAGSATDFATAPYSAVSDLLTAGGGAGPFTVGLALQYDWEGTLTGSCSGSGIDAFGRDITKRSVTPPGEFAGLFVTSLSGTLRMSAFELTHGYHATEAPICIRTFESCAKGVPLANVPITLADSSPATIEWCGGAECDGVPHTFSCGNFAGSYSVPHTGEGDGTCTWRTDWFLIDTYDCDGFTGDGECSIQVASTYVPSDIVGVDRLITVTVWGKFFGTECILARFEKITPIAIENLSAEDIPKIATPHNCHTATITCELG